MRLQLSGIHCIISLIITVGYISLENKTQKSLSDYAETVGQCNDGSVPIEDFSWQFMPDFPVDKLLSIKSLIDWKAWWTEELDIEVNDLDDPGRWSYLLKETEFFDPIVLVEKEDGSLDIWDGWHRSASAILTDKTSIKAVYGKQISHDLELDCSSHSLSIR